ncbi:MAG: type II secretion system protein J [Waddliaceae bacterium]
MKHSNSRQRGFLALETAIVLLLFSVMMVLVNNGIVNVIRQEWYNAANAAAMAGVAKLLEEEGNPDAIQLAIDEATQFAGLHTWLGRAIQTGQVVVKVGDWKDCTYVADEGKNDFTTVQVEVYLPVDEEGNLTDITAFFGRLQAPLLQTLPDKIIATATIVDDDVLVLVEDEGRACQNE